MWWILENVKGESDFEGAYSATEFGGQFITVIPKRKLVSAHKTKLDVQTQLGLKKGGVSTRQYWEIIHKLIANQEVGLTIPQNFRFGKHSVSCTGWNAICPPKFSSVNSQLEMNFATNQDQVMNDPA